MRLKLNAEKCSFGLKYITYLGYIITRYFIKPNPKEVKMIMCVFIPTNNTEAQELIGMAQYYRFGQLGFV